MHTDMQALHAEVRAIRGQFRNIQWLFGITLPVLLVVIGWLAKTSMDNKLRIAVTDGNRYTATDANRAALVDKEERALLERRFEQESASNEAEMDAMQRLLDAHGFRLDALERYAIPDPPNPTSVQP